MPKFLTASSVIIVFLASLLTIVPSLRQYVFSIGSHSFSEEEARLKALVVGQNYTSTTVFTDPLVIYLDNFLSAWEIGQLLNDSSSLFVPSQVFTQDTNSPQHRSSSSCSLPGGDFVPAVVAARALAFLDSLSAKASSSAAPALSYYGLEPLQLVKYAPSQYYHHHVDWFDALIRDDVPGKGERGRAKGRLYNRVASFFIYLQDDCLGGGTEFPDLKLEDSMILAGSQEADEGSDVQECVGSISLSEQGKVNEKLRFWNDRIEVEGRSDQTGHHGKGTTFKPRKGSGVFWVNLQESGFGDQRVRHAGLPVLEGEKVGMNIWVKRDFGW